MSDYSWPREIFEILTRVEYVSEYWLFCPLGCVASK